jgi:fatty acid desaturase
MSHTYHHRYTLHPDGDREVLLPQTTGVTPITVIQLLTINVAGFVRVIGSALRMSIPRYNMNVSGLRTSEWTRELFSLAPEIERKAIRWARLTILLHLSIIAISAIFNAWWISIVLTSFLFFGNWLVFLVGRPMHIGLRDNVPDFRLCVRSNRLNPFTSFLYWRMNWHTEHHMFAGVPCYNLKKLAQEIAPDMPELRTLWACWREMLEIEKTQRIDPTYQFDTPLPPTARPGVMTPDQVNLPDDKQTQLEASIGELAPSGH